MVVVNLLGEVVNDFGEVDHLAEHSESRVSVPRLVVGRPDVVVVLGGEECLGQALEDVDEVHDGLRAADDLAVDRRLDVVLQFNRSTILV